jgi:hypothetical protein
MKVSSLRATTPAFGAARERSAMRMSKEIPGAGTSTDALAHTFQASSVSDALDTKVKARAYPFLTRGTFF